MSPSAASIHSGSVVGTWSQPAFITGTDVPVPLVASRYDVTIKGGLASVVAERVFRNAETESIEATITFPVPVHATLYDLEARIGGRVLIGRAMRSGAARETYEGAIDDGRTAVLHEEVLRGIHQVSVANVPPGEEIAVVGRWAMPLSFASGGAGLTIPVTVGDIYGHSPLSDSDDLTHAPVSHWATVSVNCDSGIPELLGGALTGAEARVRLDAPIRLQVHGWRPRRLFGRAADGRQVSLDIEPAVAMDGPIHAAVLVDRSGSMGVAAEGPRSSPSGAGSRGFVSKHAAVVQALSHAGRSLSPADRIAVWQFDDQVERIDAASYAQAVACLGEPRGGTEIGNSIRTVLDRSDAHDILLLTDGKSHALDVQALVRRGRRIHVLLIGEDSLEARVGHLAALTGGQIYFDSGSKIDDVILRAFAAMRAPYQLAPAIRDLPLQVEAAVGGMRVHARWQDAADDSPDPGFGRAVAAAATALALPRMEESRAAMLAEHEGLVSHLTSLVLVDEAGARQQGLPRQRKVALTTPRVYSTGPVMFEDAIPADRPNHSAPRPFRGYHLLLAQFGPSIRWSENAEKLRQGDLANLPGPLLRALSEMAAVREVIALAAELGVDAKVTALALLAQASADRPAQRFARAMLRGASAERVERARHVLGLDHF